MNSLEAVIFALHYVLFFIAVVFFLLKFHKKPKAKFILYFVAALWIIFGFIDFLLGLGRFIEIFS